MNGGHTATQEVGLFAFWRGQSKPHNVTLKIVLAFIPISALAVYFYAHHNWHPLSSATTIDRIVVEKSPRRLSIFRDGKRIKTYRIALGRNPVWAKAGRRRHENA
jgi:hypothetical protein